MFYEHFDKHFVKLSGYVTGQNSKMLPYMLYVVEDIAITRAVARALIGGGGGGGCVHSYTRVMPD